MFGTIYVSIDNHAFVQRGIFVRTRVISSINPIFELIKAYLLPPVRKPVGSLELVYVYRLPPLCHDLLLVMSLADTIRDKISKLTLNAFRSLIDNVVEKAHEKCLFSLYRRIPSRLQIEQVQRFKLSTA